MSLLKVNEIQIFNGTTVTITATTTETSADLNVGADLDVTGALTLGTALAIAEGGTGATDAATARTNLDVDQAGTDNSTDCTLVTTSHDYLSIAGQAITLGPIDLAADVTGTLATSNGGTGVTSLASLDAADLGSGTATDGYVLTADGAGGAAWEAASGGAASLPIDLLSSGASIRKSDGTTAVLSESGGAVTLESITNLEADSITDKAGTGAPDFPYGLTANSGDYLGEYVIDSTYTDPNAVGANPTAVLYGDGTVVGSTDNGEYIKYPSGNYYAFLRYYCGNGTTAGDYSTTLNLPITSQLTYDVQVSSTGSSNNNSDNVDSVYVNASGVQQSSTPSVTIYWTAATNLTGSNYLLVSINGKVL